DMLLPVDVYVPGCPPRPDAVIDALIKLQKRVEREQPVRKLLANLGQTTTREDGGSETFVMPPNRANPTRRMGEVQAGESSEGDEPS
ncbi:MAG: hypothetical protein QF615_14360, partial [Planctomycetota bacterium]|nr:hypothetical protein [Planctomycetota bacterium]